MMMMRSKIVAIIAGLFLIAGIIWLLYPKPIDHPETPVEPYQTTLTGTYICLPHTDTSGPQTLECAFGLHTADNKYYALDFNMLSSGVPNIPMNTQVTGTGLVTPVAYLSNDHWQKYPITGIFSVTDSFKSL